MDKAPEAFRTISEVAELLETPAHVLRFWETRFPQVKPVKRAGGRRYYRPADVALLSGIRHLLHADGMTIRGVQKVLRDHGVRHVAGLSGDISDLDLDADDFDDAPPELTATPPASAQILSLGSGQRRNPDMEGKRGTVQPLFKPDPAAERLRKATVDAAPISFTGADTHPAAKPPSAAVPRGGEGGFIAFSPLAAPRAKTLPPTPPAQATLLFDDVPEAPHVWVEAEPPLGELTPHPASPTAQHLRTGPHAHENQPYDVVASDVTEDLTTDLTGIARRLRALTCPLMPGSAQALAELRVRLALLHAQMAEALRLRR